MEKMSKEIKNQETKPQEVNDIKIKPSENMDESKANDIFDKILNKYDDEKPKSGEAKSDSETPTKEPLSEKELTSDSIKLQDKIDKDICAEYIDKLRKDDPKVDEVISKYEKVLNDPKATEQQKMRAYISLEQYKGTIFEKIFKNELSKYFKEINEKQRTVETVDGNTKPDIELFDAKKDIKIGTRTIGKGENLGVELKCGTDTYIYSQLEHICKQVKAHENSIVVVTKDYMELSKEKRVRFEEALEKENAKLYVTDVKAANVMNAIKENIKEEN